MVINIIRGLWRPSDVSSSCPSCPSSETPSYDSSDCTSEAQGGGASVFDAYQPDISDASDVYDHNDPWLESVAEGDGKSAEADVKEQPPNPSIIYR